MNSSSKVSADQDVSVTEAVRRVRRDWSGQAQVALILGSGLGELAEKVNAEAVFEYHDLPHFPRSTALAHKGRLVCGTLSGVSVVTMQGRCHLYEGYSVDEIAFPVRVMRSLGAEYLIVSNASGGVNPHHRSGDLMVMQDHINLMWASPTCDSTSRGNSTRQLERGTKHTSAYDPGLIDLAMSCARDHEFVLHQGVYVAVSGPSYETRAEYRMFRQLGGDTVGMSTVPEVLTARQYGMRVLGLSVLTNVAKPDAPEIVDAEDVVVVAKQAGENLGKIVDAVLTRLASGDEL